MRRVSILLAVAAVAVPRIVFAQGNFQATPTGGRSALMGGTGVALGTDGAAPFLNPATLVRIDSILSVSVNLLAASVTSFSRFQRSGAIDPAFGNLDLQNTTVTDSALQVVPSTLCLFLDGPKLGHAVGNQGKEKFGACFGTVERDSISFIGHGYQSGTGRQTSTVQSLTRDWNRFVLAPTWAVYLFDDFAIGASAQAVISNASSVVAAGATTYGGGPTVTTAYESGLDANAFGVDVVLGATWRIGKWTAGAALQTTDLGLWGSTHASRFQQFAGVGDYVATYAGTGGFRSMAPWRVSVGLGKDWKWGTAELDLSAGIPQEAPFDATTKGTEIVAQGGTVAATTSSLLVGERKTGLLHAAVGLEGYLSRRVSLLGGLGTSITFLNGVGGVLPTRQTRIATSFGLGSHGEGGDLLIGTELSVSWGRTLAVNPYQLPPTVEPIDIAGFRALFVLAGSTSLKAIGRAVTDVVIDPVRREQEKERQREKEGK